MLTPNRILPIINGEKCENATEIVITAKSCDDHLQVRLKQHIARNENELHQVTKLYKLLDIKNVGQIREFHLEEIGVMAEKKDGTLKICKTLDREGVSPRF